MIIIKNKDYSVLEGLSSKNNFGMETNIISVDYDCIEIGILDSMKNECLILIHLTNVTKKYIIAELKHYGFDIKFKKRALI